MNIVVATALIGPADALAPSTFPGRYVCYTDRPVQGWECLSPPGGYARLAARRAKMILLDDFPEAEWSIWIDASFDLLVDPHVIVAAAEATGCDVAAFRHPDRHRIKEEAREIIRGGMAPFDLVNRQIAAYHSDGFDTDVVPQAALTTTGLLVRRHTRQVAEFTAQWLHEIETHTLRDQLSVDYAAWRTGVRIGYLPGHYRENQFVVYNRQRHRKGRVAA